MANLLPLLEPLKQWWQRLPKRRQLLAILLGSALAGWVVDTSTFRPLRRHVRQLDQRVREAQQQLIKAVVALGQEDVVNEAFAAYAPYTTSSDGSSGSALARLLSDVEALVRESGMTVIALKPATEREENSSTLGVAVETEASPEQFARLLDALQRSTTLLKITEMNVRVGDQGTLRGSLVITRLLVKPVDTPAARDKNNEGGS